jgi:hypothetical protein
MEMMLVGVECSFVMAVGDRIATALMVEVVMTIVKINKIAGGCK